MNDIETAVKSYILEQFLPTAKPEELTASTPLIAGGILDSLATVRVVMFLEQRFGIEIQAHEVHAENLDNLTKIATLVQRKQAGGPAAP